MRRECYLTESLQGPEILKEEISACQITEKDLNGICHLQQYYRIGIKLESKYTSGNGASRELTEALKLMIVKIA